MVLYDYFLIRIYVKQICFYDNIIAMNKAQVFIENFI